MTIFNDAQRPQNGQLTATMKHFGTLFKQIHLNGGSFVETLNKIKDALQSGEVTVTEAANELGIPAEFLTGDMNDFLVLLEAVLATITAQIDAVNKWHKIPPY
jgi:hypothetical protein